jgi:transposase-like protein
MKKEPEEQVIQKFPSHCPYCDEPISYDQFDLKIGENRIECPSCKRTFIRVVLDSLEEPKKSALRSGESKKVRRKTKRHPHRTVAKAAMARRRPPPPPSKGRRYTG